MTRLTQLVRAGLPCLLLCVPAAHARVEHHQLHSESLAAARGQTADRELSVYVPDAASRSAEGYPVFYLLHGYSGTNRTFLGAGYPEFGELKDAIHIDQVMNGLASSGEIDPIIVVLPNVRRGDPLYDAYTPYVTEEIVPFVDATYPTIARRGARAIAGHSVGGSDAVYMGLRRADLFSLVVAYSPYFLYQVGDSLLTNYDRAAFPLAFWLYAGSRDDSSQIPPDTHAMAALLAAHSVPVVSTFDEANHWDMLGQRITESIVYFSNQLRQGASAVAPATWGRIKGLGRATP